MKQHLVKTAVVGLTVFSYEDKVQYVAIASFSWGIFFSNPLSHD